ncbi:hypothetical protein CACET_c14200 [Clostridium aceticum]|uniref:Uncharacterized protein n=1 Tax=Clostridium aceticum TaxID=84022 RepID=A0A0D8ICI3_9CLOT|nr:hypothetical protein [Clostridium aceticum]AKL94884.1 hypothetical protein CACET_c14200 [Clostridium aceticum]KJF27809.1 hypothetical protein TZ02_04205 [Clostridium aceticum]
MVNKQQQYKEEDLKTIESDLESLSVQLINILKEYKAKGIINDHQYKQHVEVKERFLNYLENKRKSQ